jgi:carbon starvation protein
MIEKESYARVIGYGAMLTESFISLMALIAATVLIPGDYFAINTKLSFAELQNMGFPVSMINELSAIIGVNLTGRPGGAVSLAVGISYIFSSIPFLKSFMAYWYQFALMFEALFILTTIDAGTRVARYVLQEIGGHFYKPSGDLHSLKWNIIASSLIVVTWGHFTRTGSIATIWPMFGTANQLLSVIALCIGTSLIIKSGKLRYAWVTFVPMVFMAVITFTASIKLILAFSAGGDRVNMFLMTAIFVLACIILIDSGARWVKLISSRQREHI